MAGKIMILSVPESDEAVFDRILNVLKHVDVSEITEIKATSAIQIGELYIDSSQHIIKKGTEEIRLTNTEFQMLYFLAIHNGMAMSKEQIYEYVWNDEYFFDDSNITSHIRRLRVKIEDNPAKPRYIQTVRGIGYKMQKADNDNW